MAKRTGLLMQSTLVLPCESTVWCDRCDRVTPANVWELGIHLVGSGPTARYIRICTTCTFSMMQTPPRVPVVLQHPDLLVQKDAHQALAVKVPVADNAERHRNTPYSDLQVVQTNRGPVLLHFEEICPWCKKYFSGSKLDQNGVLVVDNSVRELTYQPVVDTAVLLRDLGQRFTGLGMVVHAKCAMQCALCQSVLGAKTLVDTSGAPLPTEDQRCEHCWPVEKLDRLQMPPWWLTWKPAENNPLHGLCNNWPVSHHQLLRDEPVLTFDIYQLARARYDADKEVAYEMASMVEHKEPLTDYQREWLASVKNFFDIVPKVLYDDTINQGRPLPRP